MGSNIAVNGGSRIFNMLLLNTCRVQVGRNAMGKTLETQVWTSAVNPREQYENQKASQGGVQLSSQHSYRDTEEWDKTVA